MPCLNPPHQSENRFSLFSGLALAFHDGSIQILHRLSLHTMGVFYGSSSGQRPGDESAIKRQRTGGPALHFKALQFSWTSLALAGVDNHGKVTNGYLRFIMFHLFVARETYL